MRTICRKHLIFVFLLTTAVFFLNSCDRDKNVAEGIEIPEVQISSLADGEYPGSIAYKEETYSVVVVIRNRQITDITVTEIPDDGYDIKAREVLKRIRQQQKLNVDAVTGATRSSKFFCLAVYNALTGKTIEIIPKP